MILRDSEELCFGSHSEYIRNTLLNKRLTQRLDFIESKLCSIDKKLK